MWMVVALCATFFVIGNMWATIALLTLIAAGTYASKGPFWALSSEWLGPTVAAAGLDVRAARERGTQILIAHYGDWEPPLAERIRRAADRTPGLRKVAEFGDDVAYEVVSAPG